MPVTEADIEAFSEFAREQAANGGSEFTLTELVAKWQATREREEVNEAIRESLADIESGRAEPFLESQDQFRQERSLPPRQ